MKSLLIESLVIVALIAVALVVLTGGRTFGTKSNQTMKQQQPENVTVRLLTAEGSLTDPINVPSVIKTEEMAGPAYAGTIRGRSITGNRAALLWDIP
jgi:hypothetical protein